MSVIDELNLARRARGLTQAQVAQQAGVSRMTVQRVENRDIEPRLGTLQEMARALGMDLMVVPSELKPDVQAFIRAGGRYLGQPAGVDAPPSIVDGLIERKPNAVAAAT
ncbi:hypothetical protein BH09PSE6_BH09PSE6_10480 [soil metagenome]